MAADGFGRSKLIIFTMCTTQPIIQSLLTTYKYCLTSSTLLTLHVLRLFAWSFETPLKFAGSPHESLFSLLSSLSSPLNKPNPIHHNSTHSFRHVFISVPTQSTGSSTLHLEKRGSRKSTCCLTRMSLMHSPINPCSLRKQEQFQKLLLSCHQLSYIILLGHFIQLPRILSVTAQIKPYKHNQVRRLYVLVFFFLHKGCLCQTG